MQNNILKNSVSSWKILKNFLCFLTIAMTLLSTQESNAMETLDEIQQRQSATTPLVTLRNGNLFEEGDYTTSNNGTYGTGSNEIVEVDVVRDSTINRVLAEEEDELQVSMSSDLSESDDEQVERMFCCVPRTRKNQCCCMSFNSVLALSTVITTGYLLYFSVQEGECQNISPLASLGYGLAMASAVHSWHEVTDHVFGH